METIVIQNTMQNDNSADEEEKYCESQNSNSNNIDDDTESSDPLKKSTEDRREHQTVTKSGRISYAPNDMLHNQNDAANLEFPHSDTIIH